MSSCDALKGLTLSPAHVLATAWLRYSRLTNSSAQLLHAVSTMACTESTSNWSKIENGPRDCTFWPDSVSPAQAGV